MNSHKSGSEYKEHTKVNYQFNLLIAFWFPYGTCSLMVFLEEESGIAVSDDESISDSDGYHCDDCDKYNENSESHNDDPSIVINNDG